jgi:hypothetical protein
MNDKVLDKLAEIEEKGSLTNALKSVAYNSNAPLSFTPVTEESFKRWCDDFKEKMYKIKLEQRTEKDSKPTGKEIFLMKKGVVGEIKLDEDEVEDDDDEEFKDDAGGATGDGSEDEDDEDNPYYDKELYKQDLDEEVDFD